MRTRLQRYKHSLLAAAVAPLSILLAIASVSPASAYRPFDGTDAAVADPGELEIELQPAGALWQQAQKTLIAPATVFNYGISRNWEVVLEGRLETPLSPTGPTSLSASALSLKHVVIPGSLQDKEGPSVATEFGLLLPDSNGASGVGASIAGIVSQRWAWGTINFNAATALTRDQHADLFLSTIIEGPAKWTVRPVAEFYYENEFGQVETISALVGLIWQVRDTLSFDVGVRQALTNGRPVSELRAGLTVGFPDLFRNIGRK
jgi:hypothetical protein